MSAALISLVIAVPLMHAAAQAPGPRPGPAAEGGPAVMGRLERVEEQLVDLQGVVAAVETLAKSNSGGGTGYSAAATGGASAEQIRQLSEQISDLTQRLERLEARLGANTGPGAPQARVQTGYGTSPAGGFEDKEQLPPLSAPQTPADRIAARPPAPPSSQVANAGQPPSPLPPVVSRPSSSASASAAGPARTLLDQALGALNRHDYAVAESYLQQVLDQYPTDPLAGNAQYWLGEAAFQSGEYDTAGKRFLKLYTQFPTSEQAPQALLKLAISLRRLGKPQEACAPLDELQKRFPKAQAVLKQADSEKKRSECAAG